MVNQIELCSLVYFKAIAETPLDAKQQEYAERSVAAIERILTAVRQS
jgi:hypothetical protein